MSKITKRQLQESHNKLLNQFASLVRELKVNNVIDDSVCSTFTKKTEPKQLDQSVFNNMHERWKFAAVDKNGSAHRFNKEVFPYRGGFCYESEDCNELKFSLIGKGYDASNWQNSLIERDIDKELTGSELCKAMLERGDKRIMCVSLSGYAMVITGFDGDKFVDSRGVKWGNAAPINNQDEPLTASEVGL